MATDRLTDKIYGCLLGGLIGDAMGAPTEGMHYRQIIEKFGPEGVTDFEGVGTDDTAIRGQLIDAIFKSDGHPTVDHFAQSFRDFRDQNRHLWFIPVRNAFHKFDQGVELAGLRGMGQHAKFLDRHGHISDGNHQCLRSQTGGAGDDGRGVVHPQRAIGLLPRRGVRYGGSGGGGL